jgi:hypothetical protein
MANSTKPTRQRANTGALSRMDIETLLDRPIAFHRIFAHAAGGPLEGLFLSQAVYWSPRSNDPDGWFFKTQAEWWEETGLSRFNQETARRKLRATGILREKRAGQKGNIYFQIDFARLSQILKSIIDNRTQLQFEMLESSSSKRQKTAARSAKKPQLLSTETTTEISTETTTTAVVDFLASLGVEVSTAQTLVEEFPEAAAQQMAWYPQRPTPNDPAAWIIAAIKRGYGAPRARASRTARAAPQRHANTPEWKPTPPAPEETQSTVEFDRTFAALKPTARKKLEKEMLEAYPMMADMSGRKETFESALKSFYKAKAQKG